MALSLYSLFHERIYHQSSPYLKIYEWNKNMDIQKTNTCIVQRILKNNTNMRN